ncbi:MAG: hypothetical protein QGF09_08520, partial [Rhodospirillales bacterium]|nr:hypothetical protein [Rhodospirillales bacterium]
MDVNLSSAIHTAISSTQRIAHLMEQSTANVSTGQQQEADAQAKDIAAGRDLGYFVTRGENVADVMAVAANLVLNGEPYGIAVAGPIQRMAP